MLQFQRKEERKKGVRAEKKTRHSRPAVVGEKKKRCGSKDSKICKRLLARLGALCAR